jgi:hypothetical protein
VVVVRHRSNLIFKVLGPSCAIVWTTVSTKRLPGVLWVVVARACVLPLANAILFLGQKTFGYNVISSRNRAIGVRDWSTEIVDKIDECLTVPEGMCFRRESEDLMHTLVVGARGSDESEQEDEEQQEGAIHIEEDEERDVWVWVEEKRGIRVEEGDVGWRRRGTSDSSNSAAIR